MQRYKHSHVPKVIVSQLTKSKTHKTSQVFMFPKIKIALTTITYLSAAAVCHGPCDFCGGSYSAGRTVKMELEFSTF